MGVTCIIPKMLLEIEDIVTLKDKGITFEEGTQTVGKTKIPCYKFYNLTEMQVFDQLESTKLYESEEQERNSFAQRAVAVIFMQLRRVTNVKDPETKVAAVAALTSAIIALGGINARLSQRFLALIRGLS